MLAFLQGPSRIRTHWEKNVFFSNIIFSIFASFAINLKANWIRRVFFGDLMILAKAPFKMCNLFRNYSKMINYQIQLWHPNSNKLSLPSGQQIKIDKNSISSKNSHTQNLSTNLEFCQCQFLRLISLNVSKSPPPAAIHLQHLFETFAPKMFFCKKYFSVRKSDFCGRLFVEIKKKIYLHEMRFLFQFRSIFYLLTFFLSKWLNYSFYLKKKRPKSVGPLFVWYVWKPKGDFEKNKNKKT